VHFFDISTAKSGPELVSFVHFDLEMCFAPQRRAIFHLSSGQLASPNKAFQLLQVRKALWAFSHNPLGPKETIFIERKIKIQGKSFSNRKKPNNHKTTLFL